MRNGIVAFLTLGLAACSPTSGEPTTLTPQNLGSFELTFDGATASATMRFTTLDGNVIESNTLEDATLPYGTTASHVFLHTRNSKNNVTTASPNNFWIVGLQAENMYASNTVNNFTAIVDSLSSSSVGVGNVGASGSGLCINGGMGGTVAWVANSCASGGSSGIYTDSKPGFPGGCAMSFGNVSPSTNVSTTPNMNNAGDTSPNKPFCFVGSGTSLPSFTMQGHITGTLM